VSPPSDGRDDARATRDEPRAARPRVVLVAGEASGDLRGAELLDALRSLVPDVAVSGMGGDRLRAAGMEILVDAHALSTMGFTELFGRLGVVLRSYRRIRAAITGRDGSGRPDLLVLIDFPDFNLRLAAVAQRSGVPVLYYVSPQVWAWRRYRVRTLARRVDRLAVVFPFEAELYAGLTDVTFVGHPALETVRARRSRAEMRRDLAVGEDEQLVALLPGSRPAEVRALLPAMVEAWERLAPQPHAVVALAHESLRPLVEPHLPGAIPARSGETWDLVQAADLALAASGSATLETALLGTPMVIMYRLSPVSYSIARLLVRVPFIGMPNLILGEAAVPELIQEEVRPERIAAEAQAILSDPARAARMRSDLARVRARLGEPGAARRAAEIAARMLGRTAVAREAAAERPP